MVTVALSTTNARKNTLYMSYLPESIRTAIYNLGVYHTYQRYLQIYSQMLELLHVDNKYVPSLEYMALSVRSLQVQLMYKIKELIKNCTFILDRSLLSSYLYSKTLTKNHNISDHHYVTNLEPKMAFFITSAKDTEVAQNVSSLQTYDRIKNINDLLYNKLYQLECEVEDFKKRYPLVLIREDKEVSGEANTDANTEYIKKIVNSML